MSTRGTNGMLRRDVVYLDFAVIPNSHPFSFCSYSTRRKDGLTPLDFHPFPKRKVWRRVQRIAQGKFVKTKGGVEAGDGEVLEEQVKDKIVATVGPKSERFLDLHDPFSS